MGLFDGHLISECARLLLFTKPIYSQSLSHVEKKIIPPNFGMTLLSLNHASGLFGLSMDYGGDHCGLGH